jgi:Xaa-Pro aminopeptidase
MNTSLDRLRDAMARKGIPALLVADPVSVAWLTGFTGSFARVLVTENDARFITDSRYTLQAKEQVPGLPLASFASPTNGDVFVGQQACEMGIKRLAFESASTTYAAYENMGTKMSEVELIPAPDLFGELRMVKTPEEIGKIRKACAIADACFGHLTRLIQPGLTEYDLQIELEFYLRRAGAGIAFEPIVVSGERSARPHGKASDKPLEVGDFVTMDFGANVEGYNSDLTRTIVVGEATERHREVYGQVLLAEMAAIEAMKPGVRAADVDALARRILDEKGLAQYFGHGLGHGLGRIVHDTGRMGATSEDVMAPGQVWTVEPGVYIPGFGGVRIEDDVVITETGVEVLTSAPKELLVLPQR